MKKAFVLVYCKIGCEQFPSPSWMDVKGDVTKSCTGDELVDYLLSDTGYAGEDIDDGRDWRPLGGDKIIWTLATNEKFGGCSIRDDKGMDVWGTEWNAGTHHVGNIREFVKALLDVGLIVDSQYHLLMAEVEFANENFHIHYDIRDYLLCVRGGKEWKKPEKDGMAEAAEWFFKVKADLEENGFKVYTPTNRTGPGPDSITVR